MQDKKPRGDTTMRLKELHLENFQGIENLTIEPNGNSIDVYGTNGTGKTTVGNSISWLLFDKSLDGVKNYTPKTKDELGNEKHNLHHSVEGTFILDDGSLLTLKKDFYEVYKKKRGSASEEFSGHTVDYYVDGVPFRQKDYQARLDSLFTAEQVKILTNPNYFSEQMSWKDRRKILLDVCGDVSDDIVITSTNELAQLPEYLLKPGSDNARYTVEEYLAIATNKRTEINKRLQDIPTRIDEAQKAKYELPNQTEDELTGMIEVLRKQIEEKQIMANGMSEDEVTSQLRLEISNIKVEMSNDMVRHQKESAEANADTLKMISVKQSEKQKAMLEHQSAMTDIQVKNMKLQAVKKAREDLLAEYKAEKEKQWTGSTICPTCNQPLPEDKIAKAVEEWNFNKSKKLKAINQKGKTECSKEVIASLEQEIANAGVLAEKSQKLLESIDSDIALLQSKLQAETPYQSTQEYASFMGRIAQIEQKIKDSTNTLAEQKQAVTSEITALRGRVEQFESLKLRYVIAKQQDDRIKQLEEEERKLAGAYENLQHGIYLCEQFIKRKVDMLDERINSKFKNVRFQLFNTLVNGALEETCTVLCQTNNGLIPWQDANNAAKISAGVEIADTLCDHWGLQAFIILDNAESVVKLPETKAQVIRLIVSEKDSKLRVETAGYSDQLFAI